MQTTAGFLLLPSENSKYNTAQLPVTVHIEFQPPPLETGKSNTFNNKKQGKGKNRF
jgi:hypothetical protein